MPSIVLTSQTLTSYLDLQTFWQELLKVPDFRFPYQGELDCSLKICWVCVGQISFSCSRNNILQKVPVSASNIHVLAAGIKATKNI